MTEETGTKHQIKDWLKLKGWFVYYNVQSMGSYKGLTDLTAVKKSIFNFPITLNIEVKTLTGKQSKHQIKFQADIEEQSGHYVIARGYEDVEFYLKSKKLNILLGD